MVYITVRLKAISYYFALCGHRSVGCTTTHARLPLKQNFPLFLQPRCLLPTAYV